MLEMSEDLESIVDAIALIEDLRSPKEDEEYWIDRFVNRLLGRVINKLEDAAMRLIGK